jgi:hypothetical protein
MTIRRVAIAAAAIAAPLAFAAPAMAAPMEFSCAPCVADVNGDKTVDPIWNEVTSLLPWESTVAAVNGGAWEKGVEAVNGGAWEKVFPPAE